LTEKSRILKFHTFHQHVGWAPCSQMHLKYTHYFGNESSDELLESYGVEIKNNIKDKDALLKPIQCPNCSESNISNAKFCAKCRMVLMYDAFSETLESEKQKDDKISALEKRINDLQDLAVYKTSKFDEFGEKLEALNKKLEEEEQQHNRQQQQQKQKQKQQQRQLINAAGRAAFLATTRKRRISGRK
jgi:hypothetical protein